MKYPDGESVSNIQQLLQGSDPQQTAEAMREQLATYREQLRSLHDIGGDPLSMALVRLEIATLLLGLGESANAWQEGREILGQLIDSEAWQAACECCDILYQSDQPQSIRALAHGVWLGITFSVTPEIVINLLHHIVDDTPDHADGAAVAAMAAHYIADVHAEGQERENLRFLTTEIVARVARRHRGIEDQQGLSIWIEMLGLDDPGQLFKALGRMLEAMAGDEWWIDRDRLRAMIAPPPAQVEPD